MGVIDQIEERDAQGRPDSDTSTDEGESSSSVEAVEDNDPFLQHYLTDRYEADSQTVDQVLALTIALANIFK